MATCRISYSEGKAVVTNEDGTLSRLYAQALVQTEDEKLALDLWATSITPEFEAYTGKINTDDNVSLPEVLAFYNRKTAESSDVLSPSERVQVMGVMKSNGIYRLSDFFTTLNNIFRKTGDTQLDPQEAVNSGLYAGKDLVDIDIEQVNDLIDKIEKTLSKEDFYVEQDLDQIAEETYKDTSRKTIIGSYAPVTLRDIDQQIRDAIEDFSTERGILEGIRKTPYTELYDKLMTNGKLRKKLLDRYKNLKRIPVLSLVNNKLTNVNGSTKATLLNTLRTDYAFEDLEIKIERILDVNQETWDAFYPDMVKILKDLELFLAKEGIDIIGISDKTQNREQVLTFLRELQDLLQTLQKNQLSEAAVNKYAEALDNMIPTKADFVVEKIPSNLRDLNLVKVSSNLPDSELYTREGLIKVGEDLYHKTSMKDDISLLYDYLYKQVIDGQVEVETRFKTEKELQDPLNKPMVLEDLKRFINGRDTGLTEGNLEEVSLKQVIWGHEANQITDFKKDIINLNKIPYDLQQKEDYLTTDFIEDFYKYYLTEKYKNSQEFKDVLSKFVFNDKDIHLKEPLSKEDLARIKYSRELDGYARLKKDPNFKVALTDENSYIPTAGLQEVNDITQAKSYDGPTPISKDDYIVVPKNTPDFINFNNVLYRKELENSDARLYAKVITSPTNVYYTTKVNTLFNLRGAADFLKEAGQQFRPSIEITKEVIKIFANDIRYDNIANELRVRKNRRKRGGDENQGKLFNIGNAPTASTDKIFEQNLVEFIRQKGVEVVTDKTTIQKLLKEFDVNPMILGEMATANIGNLKQSLDKAKEMFDKGIPLVQIELETSWFKDTDGWKNVPKEFINTLNLNEESLSKLNDPQNLEDVINKDHKIFEAYPQLRNLKVTFYEDTQSNNFGSYDEVRGIRINTYRPASLLSYNAAAVFSGGNEVSGDINKQSIRATLGHELSHITQSIEGFAKGGGPQSLYNKYSAVYDTRPLGSLLDKLNEAILSDILNPEELKLHKQTVKDVEFFLKNRYWSTDSYLKLAGEIDASTVEAMIYLQGKYGKVNSFYNVRNNYLNFIGVKKEDTLNYLQTPAGNVLGFEKDGVIYLDEEQLNDTTTVHELVHVFQSMMDIKAKNGDKQAQDIIAKRKEVFGDIANEWIKFHEGRVGVGEGNLIIDKNNKQVGKKYELRVTPQELSSLAKNKESILLEDLIDITELKKLTPDLEYGGSTIRFTQDDENAGGASLSITGNKVNGITINFTSTQLSKGADFIRKATVRLLSHEAQHLYDYANGRNYGGSSKTVEEILTRDPQKLRNILDGIEEEQSDKVIGKLQGLSIGLYLAYGGENRARKNELEENRIKDEQGVFNVEVPENLLIDSDENLQDVINNLTPEQAQLYYDFGNYYFNYTIAPEYKVNFNILGEQGAIKLDVIEGVTRRMDNLTKAKEMLEEGKSALLIKLATEWEMGKDGLWRYEIPNYFKLNSEIKSTKDLLNLEGSEKSVSGLISFPLSSILDLQGMESLYGKEAFGYELNRLGDVRVYLNRTVNIGEAHYRSMAIHVNPLSVDYTVNREGAIIKTKSTQDFREIIIHETQHFIQSQEGFEEPYSGEQYLVDLKENIKDTKEEIKNIQQLIEIEPTYKVKLEELENKLAELEGLRDVPQEVLDDMYWLSAGEIEARKTMYRSRLTSEERLRSLISETEDIDLNDRLNMLGEINPNILSQQIGLDLSSPAYAKRAGETSESYSDRILKEVEAYMTAPEVTKQLEELRKENPSLWQNIVNYIKQLTDWLKSQIGLSDYKGDIMDMSKEEYISALGISVLKDEYTPTELSEMDRIKSEAISNGTFMEAPNGKPTNLNERQWLQVRTQNFKNWFGNWENDPENSSKVVDENGEPKVVYHGTNSTFDTFKANDDRYNYSKDTGFHFGTIKAAEDINKLKGGNTILPVFLSSKNILRLEEAERFPTWSGWEIIYRIAEAYDKGLTDNIKIEDELLDSIFDEDLKLPYTDIFGEEQVGEYPFNSGQIEQLSFLNNFLRRINVDGIVYSNTIEDKGSDSYIVFNPNQIKSATNNTGTFSKETGNIYLQIEPTYQEKEDLLKNTSQILANKINVLPLLSEEESLDLLDKIDDCGS